MNRSPSKFGHEVARRLGFDRDVVSVRLHVDRVVVETYWRNRDGKFEINKAGTRAKRVLHVLRSVPPLRVVVVDNFDLSGYMKWLKEGLPPPSTG